MPNYFDTLTPKQKENMAILIKRMNAKGLTNPNTQAGLLSIVSKESNFTPKNELSYRTTANDRIRAIFKTKLGNKTDDELNKLKADDVAFFNAVYGGQYGNTAYEDGHKYRGRGFNGVTFKNAYKKYGDKIGVDLVSNPDSLNDVAIASDVMIEYFKDQFASAGNKLSNYNATNINDFKTVQDSVNAFYHANAGWGHSQQAINADPTGGKAKATERAPGFLDYVKQYAGQTIDIVKKKPMITIALTALLVVSVYVLYTQLKKK